MSSAVFLDLDKTIIEDLADLSATDKVALIKGAASAIASLRGRGYKIVVVANHDAVARGQCQVEDVEALHERVTQLLRAASSGAAVDRFYYCPYHPRGTVEPFNQDHANRKPKPGMLVQAAEDMSIDLASSWMIGDELIDIQAGRGAGTRTILLRPDADQLHEAGLDVESTEASLHPDAERQPGPNFFVVGLADAARLIAQQPRVEPSESTSASSHRQWDNAKIARLQVPRPSSAPPTREPAQTNESKTDGKSAQPAPRSFRPWNAPPLEKPGGPSSSEPLNDPAPSQNASKPPAPSDQNSSRSSEADTKGRSIEDSLKSAASNSVSSKSAKRKPADKSVTLEDEQTKLLRLILHEIRSHRGDEQEFTFLTLIAVALQLVAVVCLLGGLFMGGEDIALFVRWIGAAVVSQLMAIATLMSGR